MNSMTSMKMKTVSMNERGVLVIPEEVRQDLGLEGKTTLVLVESENEIILKKQEDVIELVNRREDDFWRKLSEESLRRAWGKEDEVWDKLVKKAK